MGARHVAEYGGKRSARPIGLTRIRLYAIGERFGVDPLVGEQAARQDLPFHRPA